MLRRSLAQEGGLPRTLGRAWPLLEAADLVGDLWTVPAYLRRCAPWLGPGEVRLLQRAVPDAWTVSDLPLLDAARRRLGDPGASRRRRRRDAAVAAERARMDRVVDTLVEADDGEGLVTMLRHQDLQYVLVDEAAPSATDDDVLGGPSSLSINYRMPTEVMAEAEPAIRAVLPDANVPVSVRSTGLPVVHGRTADLEELLGSWLAAHDDGVACVVGHPGYAGAPRVRSLTPELVKGLEFDLVVLVDPQAFGDGVAGAVDRYVAMTRTTQRLVVLTSS